MLKFCIDGNNRQHKQVINRGLITLALNSPARKKHVSERLSAACKCLCQANFGIHTDRVDSDQTAPRGSLIRVYFSIVKLQFNILKIKTLSAF